MTSKQGVSFMLVLYYALPILITGFAYGWEVGSMGGILAMPQFLDYFGTPSAYRQGAMTAALIAGEFGGSLLIGFLLSDRFGRRLTILASICVYLVGQTIIVASQDQAMFIAGRVINGLGAGGLFQTMSLYTAEITPPAIRGRMTSTLNLGIALGLLVTYWVQYGALNINGTGAWRLCFGLQLVPGAAVALIMFFRPESPRWLVRHDRSDEALQILAKLHGRGDKNDVVVRSEFEEIRVVVNFEKNVPPPSYPSLLFSSQYRRRTGLAMGLQFMQQVSGVNIVLYYAAKVFAQTGRTGPSAALLANGISSALLLIATLSLTIMIDYYGRRKPIVIGPTCMGLCLIVVGSMLVGFGAPHFDATTQAVQFTFKNVSAGNTAVAFMFLYEVFFGAFFSALPWTYQNEVFPINARGRGTALATSTNWFSNFWLGLYIPQALNKAAWKLYFVFGAINIVIAVVGFLFFPETARRSLEELDLLFTPGRSILVFRDKDACSKGSILQHGLADDPEAVAAELEKKLQSELGERRTSVASYHEEKLGTMHDERAV